MYLTDVLETFSLEIDSRVLEIFKKFFKKNKFYCKKQEYAVSNFCAIKVNIHGAFLLSFALTIMNILFFFKGNVRMNSVYHLLNNSKLVIIIQ